jgi:hypothetical protein
VPAARPTVDRLPGAAERRAVPRIPSEAAVRRGIHHRIALAARVAPNRSRTSFTPRSERPATAIASPAVIGVARAIRPSRQTAWITITTITGLRP